MITPDHEQATTIIEALTGELDALRAKFSQLADELDEEGSHTDGGLTDGLFEGAQRIRDTLIETAGDDD